MAEKHRICRWGIHWPKREAGRDAAGHRNFVCRLCSVLMVGPW